MNRSRTRRLLCVPLAILSGHALFGCGPGTLAPQPVQTTAASGRRTTTPEFRTDADTRERHERIVAEVARGGHEICFLGASIIERWAIVGKDDWNAVWLPRHAVDCGIGGDRTQHVLARLDHGLLDALAAPNNDIKWVVLNIGSNNTDVDSSEDIAAGTLAIIHRLQERLPNAHIVLSLLFPRGQWPNPLRDTITSVNVRLAATLARDPRVHLLNIGRWFLKSDGEIPSALMPDYLHPTAAGYVYWSNGLEKIVK